MGKPSGRRNKSLGELSMKSRSSADQSPKAIDDDDEVFISMAQELKDEGNKLFQKRDLEGAMFNYEKAIKLLPKTHIDVAYLRSNMAACYMQIGISEYPKAILECNLALEVCPKYSKALLKRAKCYEALNKLDFAYKDVELVLNTESNNVTAMEIAGRVKRALERKGITVDDNGFSLAPEYTEIPCVAPYWKVAREKIRKKKNKKAVEVKKLEDKVVVEENQDKQVVEENLSTVMEDEPQKIVKLVFGEDIRLVQLPVDYSVQLLKETVRTRYMLKDFLIKYKDQEGDLVTITSTEELRLAEAASEAQGSVRLYVIDSNPREESLVVNLKVDQNNISRNRNAGKGRETEKKQPCIEDWIIQFARVFKNHVGFDSDSYLDLHEIGMKLYSEAMEDTVTSEEAQDLFDIAGEKFQEMAALGLFNWGNVHMSKARKKVFLSEGASREVVLKHIKAAYEWAQKEYMKAGMRYETALKINPDFYEALLALGQQQFEQAKLSWHYAIASKVDLATWPSTEVLQLFNNAEDNMEKGTTMWEEMEKKRLKRLSIPDKTKIQMQKMGLDGLFNDVSADEAQEQAADMKSQINLLWGTILYERSIVEFKLRLPGWEECLEVAVEKFELAGASPTDIAVMIKNHCANTTAFEGLSFKIDEIVQAWNEMYDAKRWKSGIPSFRLEPLFRRRVPQLHDILEDV